jgi:hypothetical protein
VRHVLVSSSTPDLADELREIAPPSTTFVNETGVDPTLERLARSARIDAVVTDDPEIVAAIRTEIPGVLPILLVNEGEEPMGVFQRLMVLIDAS